MVTLAPRLSTRFHRKLASREWVLSLAAYIEKAIAARDEYATSDGEGVVYSEYNEARYLGPRSVCKYFFVASVEVSRIEPPGDRDKYTACVEYHRETRTFTTRYETIDTKETRQKQADAEAQRIAAFESAASQLRERFENREAIYTEKGALRVRVPKIQSDRFGITAEVEEIPTVGFENRNRLFYWQPDECRGEQLAGPLRWTIGTSDLRIPSSEIWSGPYSGWTLYFAPQVVQGIVQLAARWRDDLPAADRYDEVCRFLIYHAY